ncbi:MAG: transglycosylase SLT domain-containing protein [Terriglobia bacterium]
MSEYAELVNFYAGRFKVPPALALAQMQQESDGNPQARSRVGAVGLFQVMPSTAAWLESFPEPAVSSGVWFLRHLYDGITFAATNSDRWQFALAEYNDGPGSVARARRFCEAAQKNSTVWANVKPYTPPETQNYVRVIWERSTDRPQAAAVPIPIDPDITVHG